MILNEHVACYIESLLPDVSPKIEQLEARAVSEGVPIIRHDMQRFLRFILENRKPRAILEIGTAVGFSTIYMHEFAPDAQITTIEKVEMRLVHARENLKGIDKVRLIEKDATEALKELVLEGAEFDFVFLDAAKAQYLKWLPDILKLLTDGGMLITDNVLLEGTIAESKFAVTRRDRTIHMRMKEYLQEITHSPLLDTIVLPIGDGAAVSIKNKMEREH